MATAVNFSRNINVTNVKLTSVEPRYSSTSWTGQRTIRDTGIQFYEMKFSLSFNIRDIREVESFIAQYANGTPFTMSLGLAGKYRGSLTGSVLSAGVHNKGTTRLTLNKPGLVPGDKIQFSNHNKLYRVVANNGNTIDIFPALQNTVQFNENINYDNLRIELSINPDNDFTIPIETVVVFNVEAKENVY